MHFQLTNQPSVQCLWVDGVDGVRIGYLNLGSVKGCSTPRIAPCGGDNQSHLWGNGGDGPVRIGTTSRFELDHCYCRVTGDYADTFLFTASGFSDSGYDGSLIHDNEIWIPGGVSAAGPDVFQAGGSGFSIYSNTVGCYYSPTYNSDGCTAQHSDFLQCLVGSYIKVYANDIMDIGNSACESGPLYGDINHVLIYNNVVSCTWPRAAEMRGFEFLTYDHTVRVNSSGQLYNDKPSHNRDIHICNNTFMNFNYNVYGNGGWHQPIAMIRLDGFPVGSANYPGFIGCSVENNLAFNYAKTVAAAYSVEPSVAQTNNFVINDNVKSYLVHYSGMVSNQAPDARLTALGASLLRFGKREPFFSTDKDGIARPIGSAWVVGAFESGAANTNPVVSVYPSSLDFGFVAVGTNKDLTVTVGNVGGGILSGTAIVGDPFVIVSGGVYSLRSNQSQSVIIRYQPKTSGTYNTNVIFNGGGGKVAPVKGVAHLTLPTSTAVAAADVNCAPVENSKGIVSQSVDSGVADRKCASDGWVKTARGEATERLTRRGSCGGCLA